MLIFAQVFFQRNYVCMKIGEAEAASVLDGSANKAEKPMLFQSCCHLTMVTENN